MITANCVPVTSVVESITLGKRKVIVVRTSGEKFEHTGYTAGHAVLRKTV